MSAAGWMRLLGLVGPPQAVSHPVTGAFAEPPVVAWVRPLPAPESASPVRSERGQPVFHDGSLYMGSSVDDALLVLDPSNGALRRRLPAGAPVQAAPVVGPDRVWFSDTAGYTWCYRLSDGAMLWKHFSGAPLLDSPTVSEGSVYVTNVDDVVFALDASTGELLWRHAVQLDPGRHAELELFGAPSPTVTSELVLTGHSDGTLVALRRADGEPVWQRRVGQGRYPDLIAPAVVIEDPEHVVGDAVLTMGYAEPTLALGLDDRVVRWRLDEVGGAESVAREGSLVYIGGVDGKLRAVDTVDGEVRWTWDSGTSGALAEPVLTPAGVLIGASAGGLSLVNRATGETVWSLALDHQLDGVSAAPAVAGDEAWVLTNAGNLVHLVSPGPRPAPDRLRATGETAPRGRVGQNGG